MRMGCAEGKRVPPLTRRKHDVLSHPRCSACPPLDSLQRIDGPRPRRIRADLRAHERVVLENNLEDARAMADRHQGETCEGLPVSSGLGRGVFRAGREKLAFRVLIGPLKFAQRTKADRARLALLTSRSGSQLLEVVPQIFDEAAALLVPTPAVGVLSVW